ncbi:hypothetical protein C8D87_114101 [Lentzea atacamensis]|uniref:Uncharacterized protein n=1 Tax=Lentzea atacamensis TaxID=531938 RepID=A0ABX9DW25_9PSEU|nr:hypothetical protein [Lentzea atacamensis]RAS59489.1 hypothetical protein C8D87_114101 [Lentzea atacamensis]
MSPIRGYREPLRHRLRLVQVGMAGNVSAAVVLLNGMRGLWEIVSSVPLEDFLSRPNLEIPDGTPLIRLDLTGEDVYFDRVSHGPYWDGNLRAGHVHPSLLGEPRRYDGEPWTAMRGWYVAPDVYAALAPAAGVVVHRLTGRDEKP